MPTLHARGSSKAFTVSSYLVPHKLPSCTAIGAWSSATSDRGKGAGRVAHLSVGRARGSFKPLAFAIPLSKEGCVMMAAVYLRDSVILLQSH